MALQGAAATARVLNAAFWTTRLSTIQGDYSAGTADIELVNGDNGFGGSATPLYQTINSWGSTFAGKFGALAAILQNTLVKMADRDSGGLQQRTFQYALQYLINQMQTNGTTVNATTVSVGPQTAVGTPVGNPVVVLSEKNGAGAVLQYPFGETFAIATTADAQTGGQTAGQEQLTFRGGALVSNSFSYLWPGGSGVARAMNLCSPAVSNGGANANLLTNGTFVNFNNGASGAPADNWSALVGAAQMSKSSTAYFGPNSTQFAGDSSTLTSMAQQFNTPASTILNGGGTPAKVQPQTPYAFVLWYKLSSASPAAGVLAMELVDGTNAIIADSASTDNTASVNLNGVADTNWHSLTGVFRLPAGLPAAVKARVRLSTALTAGTNVFIGGVAANAMTPLYQGGPFASPFSGPTNTLLNDAWTQSFTPTFGTVQIFCERFFGMKSLGLQIPATTSSPTVADSVVA